MSDSRDKKVNKNRDKERKKQLKINSKADGLVRQKRLQDARSHPKPGYDWLEKTRILHDVISPKLLHTEPGTRDFRAPENGYVDAFQATEEFTRAYVDVYPVLRRKYFDSTPHACPVDPEFVKNDPGLMNALFAARQYADYLGMPYKPFILMMSTELITTAGYRRVPLPNHLYPKDEKSKAVWHGVGIAERHRAAQNARTEDWDLRLLARNYTGDPAQERALQYMVDNPLHAGIPQLARLMSKGWISPEQAQLRFRSQQYENAIDRVGIIGPLPRPMEDLAQYRPHCLGMHREGIPACASCPWQDKCAGLVARAKLMQAAATGYSDRQERERVNARERQRAKRQRDRDAKLLAEGTPMMGTNPPGPEPSSLL